MSARLKGVCFREDSGVRPGTMQIALFVPCIGKDKEGK